ncbi:MAG: hypothetical protein ACJ77M_18410, partial [Thermoleophilaceae bacterium]
GLGGRTGRTLAAVVDAFDDASFGVLQHLVAGDVSTRGGIHVGVGGLRGGFARLAVRRKSALIRLHRYVYVPGVRVTTSIRVDPHGRVSGRIVIQGRDAVHGTLRIGRNGRLTGRLGGHRLHAHLAGAVAAARARASHASEAADLLRSRRVPPAIRRALGSLP